MLLDICATPPANIGTAKLLPLAVHFGGFIFNKHSALVNNVVGIRQNVLALDLA